MSDTRKTVSQIMTPLVAAGVDAWGFPTDCCDFHPECTHVYYAVQVYEAAMERLSAAEAEVARLRGYLDEIGRIDADSLDVLVAEIRNLASAALASVGETE